MCVWNSVFVGFIDSVRSALKVTDSTVFYRKAYIFSKF